AREQEPIEAREDLVGRQVLGERRHQEWYRARALGNRGHVFLGDLMHDVVALAARAAGDRHGGPGKGAGGFSRHGDWGLGRWAKRARSVVAIAATLRQDTPRCKTRPRTSSLGKAWLS